MNKRNFRLVIILGWATFAAAVAAQALSRRYLPPQLQDFLAAEQQAKLVEGYTLVVVAALLILVFSLVTQVGLFLLKSWARPCYVVSFALSYLFVLFVGSPTVTSATGYALASLNAALSGFVLALIYFSPFKRLFGHSEGLT